MSAAVDSRRATVLSVSGLTVAYRQGRAWLPAVREVSLNIAAGQTYGLVGESGSGKTTLALAIMRYLPPEARVEAGRIEFAGRDLLRLSPEAMRGIWGSELNLVPQDPLSSLNPSLRLGEQVAEALRAGANGRNGNARERTLELLRMVRLPDPERVAASYPHQVSGGMQQRVLIAMAMSTNPRLLVLDEPTTGLDVTTEAAMLDLLRDLTHAHGTASLYVTHNLGVVARVCARVAVMYAGELVEDGTVAAIFRKPLHPYTQGLIDSIPRLGARKAQAGLSGLPGQIPPLEARAAGCVFAPRCPLALEVCHRDRPPLDEAGAGRFVRCHRWPEIDAGTVRLATAESAPPAERAAPQKQAPVLTLDDLEVHIPLRRSVLDVLRGRLAPRVRSVDGVSLVLEAGQTLGLVGESGSGKSTLARAVMGLADRTGGTVELLGAQLPASLRQRGRDVLRRLQLVAQNPAEALNPYLTVGETLSRPLITLLGQSPAEARAAVPGLLAAVRLPADYAERLPSQLSGGEKQRVAIARAFAADPNLLVADEPVSSLDVSVQASILNLLNDLQYRRGTAMLFISHDIAVVGYMADVIAVLYRGYVMEVLRADDLLRPPHHPYTEALLAAVPVPDPAVEQPAVRLHGEVPSALEATRGCPFHTRCPRFLGDICVNETPPWRVAASGARIFCHIPLHELETAQAPGAPRPVRQA